MRWWEEVKGDGGAVNVRFGGPTGVYNFIVLMSWWCLLLKGQLDNELADYSRTLEDIDHVFLSAVQGENNPPPAAPSLNRTSPEAPTILPAPKRGSKRTASKEQSSRKRLWSGPA